MKFLYSFLFDFASFVILRRIFKPNTELMKKMLFATLFAISASAAFSQGNINKGDLMLGGSAGFNSGKFGDYKATSVALSPDAGYFFINNLAGGLRVSVYSSKEKYISDETTNSGFHVAPFVRYYFLPSTQKVNIFADGSFGFGQSKSKSTNFESKNDVTMFAIKAGPAIFLTPATALELTLGYNSTKTKSFTNRQNNFGFEAGFQIHIPGTKKK
jgi:hypothetical protein